MKDTFQPTKADRSSLSFDKRELLETKILPTARSWLKIDGLKSHGEATLAYWGEGVAQ